jgi:PilZ domain-containing protein
MSTSCTIVIAPADLMQPLCDRLRSDATELVPCVDSDIRGTIDTVVQRRPGLVAIERVFASTSRGAALIGRLKADPALLDIEIRIVSHDSDYSRVSPRRPVGPGADGSVAVAAPAPALDQGGTRRAARTAIVDGAEILIDGGAVRLIDLSTVGAQVLSPAVLRPNQRVRVSMVDEKLTLRFQATIVWATFELPGGGSAPRYRAGLAFTGADAGSITEYATRHRRREA